MMAQTALQRRVVLLPLAGTRPSSLRGQPCCQRHVSLSRVHCKAAPLKQGENDSSPGVSSSTAQVDISDPPSSDASEQHVRSGWDPENLFSSSPAPGTSATGTMDMFAARAMRRAQQAAAAAAAAAGQAGPGAAEVSTPSTTPTAAAQGAAPAKAAASSTATPSASASSPQPLVTPKKQQFADPLQPAVAGERLPGPGARRDALSQRLRDFFMPVNLEHPGLQLLHLDPPIFLVDNFLSSASCAAFMAAADATGRLVASKVGAGNVAGGGNTRDERRTSSSLLLDGAVTAQHPELAALVLEAQESAWRLLDGGKGWGRAGKMPAPQQYCFESPQVACYQDTQHFLSHEDGFPAFLARLNGFQRHATLLVYLNDVAKGGATRFDHLGVSVQPKRGTALLFFPSYSDGRPDERTLHCAEAAQDVKWITQQWIARGWGASPQAAAPFTPEVTTVKVPVAPAKQPAATGRKRKSAGRKKGGFQ